MCIYTEYTWTWGKIMICKKCNSFDLSNKGIRFFGTEKKTKFVCNNCHEEQYEAFTKPVELTGNFVITSAVQGASVNKEFLETLKTYCAFHSATLIVLPVLNKSPFSIDKFPTEIKEFINTDISSINGTITVNGAIKLGSTLAAPLANVVSMSKGKSIIMGHPQVSLKSLPRKNLNFQLIATTTGAVTHTLNHSHKTGYIASFNHSYSAVVIIKDESISHIRHLNFDGTGFYDLAYYFTPTETKNPNKITAIVTGDEHVQHYSETVYDATYGPDGIVNKFKPDYIVRHDVLDCHSISHHHRNDVFARLEKKINRTDSITTELEQTISFIEKTTPEYCTTLIVDSNHNNHLKRWLQEAEPKQDLVNITTYYLLMYLMTKDIESGNPIQNPFELWYNYITPMDRIKFISDDSVLIEGIDISSHGDRGANGSRGSVSQFAELNTKTIIGHSHQPSIDKGAYQVGTSSNLRLDYNKGLSSWHNCHCLIYPNGKRQLVFIQNGKWGI